MFRHVPVPSYLKIVHNMGQLNVLPEVHILHANSLSIPRKAPDAHPSPSLVLLAHICFHIDTDTSTSFPCRLLPHPTGRWKQPVPDEESTAAIPLHPGVFSGGASHIPRASLNQKVFRTPF